MGKTIGIIGGMGPLATCDLMEKIIGHTRARRDQEHIHLYVDCNTNIPDRTEAILHHGQSPVPELVKSAVRLQTMGADVLVMPCNTAHYFYEQIVPYVDIPLLHMPQEAAACLHAQGIRRAALLATDGTVCSGVYGKVLAEAGIEVIYPTAEEQKLVMGLIYDCIKVGRPCPYGEEIRRLAKRLWARGAEVLLLACTELPIAFADLGIAEGTADPTEILAQAAVRRVGAAIC